MSSKSSSENLQPSWSTFFDDHPDHQEFKQALFVELYAQFNVDAEIITSEDKMPILRANINYDGNNENIFDDAKAIKNIYAINLIHRVLAEYRGLRYLIEEDSIDEETLNDIFLEFLEKLDNININLDLKDYLSRLSRIESTIQAKFAAFLSMHILDKLELPLSPKRNIKYYQDCLAHIRFLSSLLDPALTLQVIINDVNNNTISTYTAHPITKKTDLQKQRIRANKNVQDFEDWANLRFNPLLVQDNTQLPALCRSSHLHTLKNAYLVECQFEANGKSQAWSYTRSASLTYIGAKHSREVLEEAFRENILQLQTELKNRGLCEEDVNAKDVPIEILSLTTGFPVEFMDEIKVSKRTREFINTENTPSTTLAYIPVNEVGTFSLGQYSDGTTIPRTYGKKHERILIASDHAFNQVQANHHIHIHCQSGWDRTSVVDTLLNIRKEQVAYQELAGLNIESTEIEKKYRLGLLAPILGDLVQSGSFGMKPNTKTGNWQGFHNLVNILNHFNIYPTKEVFSDETNDYYYWDIAKTNRRRPIDKTVLATELEESFSEEIATTNGRRPIDKSAPPTELEELASKGIVKKSQQAVSNLIYNPYDEKTHYEYLDMLEEVQEAGPDYSTLLITLLVIFSIIMIAVGLLCVIPTAGASTLVTTLAFIGLSITLEYAAACVLGTTALVLGVSSAVSAITWLFYKAPKQDALTTSDDMSISFEEEEQLSIG